MQRNYSGNNGGDRRPSNSNRFGGRSSGGSNFRRPPSNGGGRSFGPRRSGGNRFGGRRNFGGGRAIDISKLINKPQSITSVTEHEIKNKFADFMVDERIKKNIATKGYISPTAIQDQAIPEVLSGKDVVGLANTGTGKTAAFLIPLLDKILKNPNEKVLVVVPTRELAIQIEDELRGFAKNLSIFGVVCVGGASIVPQIRMLQMKHNFIIGTPGRIKDLIERKKLNLSSVKTVVLDEADRMLDMGFVADIKYMMSLVSSERQTLFFSATVTPEIELLINKFLKDPIRVSVRVGDTSKNITQDVIKVAEGKNKITTLSDLLKSKGFDKVLIFGKTKHGVERLTRDLINLGFKAESIHGNKTHGRRQKALSLFKSQHIQVLVATDVAARGLDISGVTHVINYDLPATYEDYVHRIGRTGRGGKFGIALSFVD